MELSVLIEPIAGDTFRATSGEPFHETAEGNTREQALERLREQITARVRGGGEVVRLQINLTPTRQTPLWPNDQFTADWLEGIAAARSAANQRPDPWDSGVERP